MSTPVLIVVIVLAVAVVVVLGRTSRVTIFDYERGLRFRRGRLDRVLEPGAYWHFPAVTRIHRVDIRPTRVAVAGQEVLSADGVAVKASLVATYKIADPQRAVLGTDDFRTAADPRHPVRGDLEQSFRSTRSRICFSSGLTSRRG